jgi:phosphoribosyl-AMP cyclohydrolase
MKTVTQPYNLDFNKNDGLIPAIVQNASDKAVLMLGYMNEMSLQKTLETKYVHFWSRSRNELWMKGETSGNKLLVSSVLSDCDNDTLLVTVELEGSAVCHTGAYTCFFNTIV